MIDRERAKESLLKAMGDSYLGPPCPHSPIWHINLDAMLDAILLVVDPIIRADERQHTPYSRTAAGVRAHAEAVAAQLVEVICQDAMTITALARWKDHTAQWMDVAHIYRCERNAARAEVADLTRWKEEATAVIEAWERIWRLLGEPGFIGESKAEATWVEVRDLLDARGELVEAKRARREAERDRDFTIAMANSLMVERDAARAERDSLAELIVTPLRKDDPLIASIRRETLADLRAKAEGLGHWIDCEAFENLNEGSDYGNENIRETGEPCSCLIGEFLALIDGGENHG